MSTPPAPDRNSWARDITIVALAKTVVSAGVIFSGFRALSDDDYSRVVIAQRFAHAPSWDPSGTSWLPFPFWLQGGVMLIFGRDLDVARGTAFVLGVAAAVLVYVAARVLGVLRRNALAGALIAIAIPYAAWLGVATVPEGITAALVLFGAATAKREGWVRVAGAIALLAACLSRYEAWPVALGFALLAGWDAVRKRNAVSALAALLAIAGPLGWLAHGARAHGDAWFFLTRVADYRRAVGGASAPLLARIFGYPLALLRCEPELFAVMASGIAAASAGSVSSALGRYRRLALLMSALLAFLVIGDLYDGAPTHHAERALLPIWLAFAVVAGDVWVRAWSLHERARRLQIAAITASALLLSVFVIRPWFARRDSFVDRSDEVAIGRAAARAAAPTERVAIDTTDFGFYAVIAGFGAPDLAFPLDDRDPRRAPLPNSLGSEKILGERLSTGRASWLVARAQNAKPWPIAAQNGAFILVRAGAWSASPRPGEPSRPP